MDSKVAFVIGNGVSRRGVKLDVLSNYGTIYGCNALYRDFSPDHLISVDVKMIKEIHDSGYSKNNKVWVNPHHAIEHMTELNILDPVLGWSSGPTALHLATTHGNDQIYIIGFDFKGVQDGQKFNNIYADTPNYRKSIDHATFFKNWFKQTVALIKNNGHIQFKRVMTLGGFESHLFRELPNYSTTSVKNFQNTFKC